MENNNQSIIPNSSLFNKNLSYQVTQKTSPLKGKTVDYMNIDLLKEYMSESHKILSGRMKGVNRKEQKKITTAIKRAQHLALLPFG